LVQFTNLQIINIQTVDKQQQQLFAKHTHAHTHTHTHTHTQYRTFFLFNGWFYSPLPSFFLILLSTLTINYNKYAYYHDSTISLHFSPPLRFDYRNICGWCRSLLEFWKKNRIIIRGSQRSTLSPQSSSISSQIYINKKPWNDSLPVIRWFALILETWVFSFGVVCQIESKMRKRFFAFTFPKSLIPVQNHIESTLDIWLIKLKDPNSELKLIESWYLRCNKTKKQMQNRKSKGNINHTHSNLGTWLDCMIVYDSSKIVNLFWPDWTKKKPKINLLKKRRKRVIMIISF